MEDARVAQQTRWVIMYEKRAKKKEDMMDIEIKKVLLLMLIL